MSILRYTVDASALSPADIEQLDQDLERISFISNRIIGTALFDVFWDSPHDFEESLPALTQCNIKEVH